MTTALILIDIQSGFGAPDWGGRNNPAAEVNAARLLAHWREKKAPVIHIRHLSTNPESPLFAGQPGAEFNPLVSPLGGEPVLEKSVNSAFIGTDLEARLNALGIRDLVICGLTTPHCVSTSVRMAANLGFAVRVAEGACAAFASSADMGWKPGAASLSPQVIHETALAHLHGEFANVVSVASILATDPSAKT